VFLRGLSKTLIKEPFCTHLSLKTYLLLMLVIEGKIFFSNLYIQIWGRYGVGAEWGVGYFLSELLIRNKTIKADMATNKK
jgi:hypothetical protein